MALSDPAELDKVTDRHKLLCQSWKEPLPVGGIASAYGQKCSITSSESKIPRVFQPTFLGPKAKQSVETHTRPEQTQYFPQGRKIQNRDTRNHQDVPPTRGVGHLNRLQGRLLAHTNTGTVQEIPKIMISCPRSVISIQGTAIRTVHSSHGVHYYCKGFETDGHTQVYKDPPVPRQLVSESQIPPSLSPTYSETSRDLS